jgi:hypothetical protein
MELARIAVGIDEQDRGFERAGVPCHWVLARSTASTNECRSRAGERTSGIGEAPGRDFP